MKPGTGIDLCIEKALAHSGVAREDVNYINAHAASTLMGDLKEHRAITRFFAKNPEVGFMENDHFQCIVFLMFKYQIFASCFAQLRINSTKSMIGHLLGASGAIEAVATIKVCC